MADNELRTATELDGSTGFELADTDIMPITKAATASGLFKTTLATLKDYFTTGVTSLPAGGTAGQVLTKIDGTDGHADWETPSGGAGTITESIIVAVGDEATAIVTGVSIVTFRMPYAFTVTAVRASLTAASSSGDPTVDIKESGVSILSTPLSIDSGEKTSTTAATAAVISDAALADDAEITIDISTAGTGAKGLKVYIIGHQ